MRQSIRFLPVDPPADNSICIPQEVMAGKEGLEEIQRSKEWRG